MINNQYQLIRRPEVLKLTARSKSALFLDEKNGLLCPAISIGDRAVAYIKYEVEQVVNARISGKSKDEIIALVKNLLANRTAGERA